MKTFLKPLTPAEEKSCLRRCREGDLSARNLLIEHNLRLVAHVAKKYQTSGEDPDDLISIGTIGLIKAVATFDAEKSSRLSTYAARCIDNAILPPMRLWFRDRYPGVKMNRNGAFWRGYPRICMSFAGLMTAVCGMHPSTFTVSG